MIIFIGTWQTSFYYDVTFNSQVDSDLQSALLQFNDGCILRSIQPHNFYLRKITSNPLNFFPASCADVMRNSDVTNDAMKQAEVGCEHLLFCYENFFHEWSRFVKFVENFFNFFYTIMLNNLKKIFTLLFLEVYLKLTYIGYFRMVKIKQLQVYILTI